MTQSTASFIDQLEQAASGKELVLEPVVELIESVEEKIEEPVEEKKELFTGSVENAMQELSSLFESTFAVDVPTEEPVVEETPLPILVAQELGSTEIVEEVSVEIEPTIDTEVIETATTELMDLFEIMAGVDLETGEKIEQPVEEEVIDIPVPLPTTYSTVLNGSRSDTNVLSLPKFAPTEAEKQNAASAMILKDWASATKNVEASRVITDVTNILERHKDTLPPAAYKVLESDAVEKTVDYINDHVEISEAEFSNDQSMPFTGANLPLVSQPQFTFAVGNILRKMMATGPGSGDVELVNLEDVDASNISATHQFLAWDATVEKFVAAEGTTPIGDISGVIAGTGLTGGGTSGTVTLALDTGINATNLADGSVTNTELQYINSLTSNAQTQITAVETIANAAASKGFAIAMGVALG